MGSRNKEQVAGQCVRSSEERGRGWLWGIVTTDHTNVSLEAAIKLFMCWGGSIQVPDCRAVREQRLSVK